MSRSYISFKSERGGAGGPLRRGGGGHAVPAAKSGKLDAAFSKRLYKIILVKQYSKVKRPAGFKIAPTNELTKPEPGLYRAAQLQRVALDDNGDPVQNPLSASDVEALNDPSKRLYVPFKILQRKANRVLVQWRGYPRSDATWEPADAIKL